MFVAAGLLPQLPGPVILAQFHDAPVQQLWRSLRQGDLPHLRFDHERSQNSSGPNKEQKVSPPFTASKRWQFRPFRPKVMCDAA